VITGREVDVVVGAAVVDGEEVVTEVVGCGIAGPVTLGGAVDPTGAPA
jgi:hypothetical protein